MASPGSVALPAAFDDLEIGITLHDAETGTILDVNDRLEELYGYSADELRAMEVGDYSVDDADRANRIARERIQAAAGGEPQVFEWRVEPASGGILWVRVRLNATTIDGHECVFAEIRDISEYKARERRLRLLNRIVRHNLRNDANVLLGHIERLASAIDADDLQGELAELRSVAEEIGTLSDSVRQLEEITDPSRSERTPADVGEVTASVLEDVREQYPAADCSLSVQSSVRVPADDGLRYALGHAVENAIVHNDADTPSVTVTVDAAESDDRAILSVADDGPPIPQMEIDALDESIPTTTTSHGTGVGLWVMHWCVESLGGDLRFEANEPRGNVVRFELPTGSAPGERAEELG